MQEEKNCRKSKEIKVEKIIGLKKTKIKINKREKGKKKKKKGKLHRTAKAQHRGRGL